MLIIMFLSNNSMVAWPDLPLCKGCGLWDYPRIPSRVSLCFLLLVQITKMLPLWDASVTLRVLCEMSKYEQESLVHIHWVHWQCIVAIGWSSLLLGITCGMATLFHNCSLLGFVPLEALEGLSTQRVWHGASQRGDESRVRGGPALFITKLMMTYVAFTRYFTRGFLNYRLKMVKGIPTEG